MPTMEGIPEMAVLAPGKSHGRRERQVLNRTLFLTAWGIQEAQFLPDVESAKEYQARC